jgi:hypothetical protein
MVAIVIPTLGHPIGASGKSHRYSGDDERDRNSDNQSND